MITLNCIDWWCSLCYILQKFYDLSSDLCLSRLLSLSSRLFLVYSIDHLGLGCWSLSIWYSLIDRRYLWEVIYAFEIIRISLFRLIQDWILCSMSLLRWQIVIDCWQCFSRNRWWVLQRLIVRLVWVKMGTPIWCYHNWVIFF